MKHVIGGLALLLAAGAAAPVAAWDVKAGDLTLIQPEVRASLGANPNTAAYLTISNKGARSDRLVSVSCACATSVMIHSTETVDGVSRMRMGGPIIIPPGGKAVFAQGAHHIMLSGLKTKLNDGAVQEMTLRFERAGVVKVPFRVKAKISGPERHH